MDYYAIIDYLDSLRISQPKNLNKSTYEKLNEFSRNHHILVREEVAELLFQYSSDNAAKKLLISLANDKNALVRTQAVDSLGEFSDRKLIGFLEKIACRDKSYLVRGYAVQSMTRISIHVGYDLEKTKTVLLIIEKNDRNRFVKLNCYHALYGIGEYSYLADIFHVCRSSNYQHRCAAINALIDIANTNNKKEIEDYVKRTSDLEKTVAEDECYDELKNKLQSL